MISRMFSVSAILLLGLNLYAQPDPVPEQPAPQQPVAQVADEKPPSDLHDDMELRDWTTAGDKMADRMVNLGVESAIAQRWSSSREQADIVLPEFKSLRLGPHLRTGVLFLPCNGGMDTAYLYLFVADKLAWKVTDHLELDCHYDDKVSFEIASIHDPKNDEIQIHHACVGHGTGYWEQEFSIYSANGRKFKLEMSTDDLLRSFPAGGNPLELKRNSIFTVIPVAGARSRAIEETRSQIRNGKFTVQRRQFRWNPAHAHYEPSPFTPVVAAAN